MIKKGKQISDKASAHAAGGQMAQEANIWMNDNGEITMEQTFTVLSDTANEDGTFNIIGTAKTKEEAQRLAQEHGVSDKITYRTGDLSL